MKTLYLAKEPGLGVRNDLSRLSGEVTIVDCLNGYSDWYKKKGYNCISKTDYFELSENMHFDRLIGNPPYSNRSNLGGANGGGCATTLDTLFFLKGMEIADHVSLIIRSKHFTEGNSTFRKKLFSSGQLVSIKYLPKETFPTIQNTETCIVTWDMNHKGPCKITYMDGTVVDKDLHESLVLRSNDPNFEGVVDNNMSHRFTRGELSRNKIVDSKEGIDIVEIIENSTLKIRKINPEQTTMGYCKHGVIMNLNTNWDSLGKMFIKPYKCAISSQVIFLETSGDEESHRLIDYLNSESVASKIPSIKKSFSNSKYVFTMIPDLI